MGLSRIVKVGAEDRCLALMSEQRTLEDISSILSAEFNARIDSKMVSRYLKSVKKLKNEVTKEVIREKIGTSLPAIADILNGDIGRLLVETHREDIEFKDKLPIYAEIRKHSEVMLKYFGLGNEAKEEVINISIIEE